MVRAFGDSALGRVLRLIVAVVLMVVLAYGVEWESIPPYLEQLSWPAAIASFIGLTLQFAISAWKWQWALRLHGMQYPYRHLLKAICIGFFFNHFLPSAIGGDAYRVVKTLPSDGYASRALSAVVIERIVGFAALMLIACLGALDLARQSAHARLVLVVCLAGMAAIALLAWAVYRGWHQPLIDRLLHTRMFAAVDHNLKSLRSGGSTWVPLLAISLLFQLVAIAIIYGLFVSLGNPVPYSTCAVIAAAAGIATVLPISINGLGVVEGAFVGSALALDVPYEPALVVAVLLRVLLVPYALAFGVLYAVQAGRRPKTA
jgi:glycosyltransferase 2 family protein